MWNKSNQKPFQKGKTAWQAFNPSLPPNVDNDSSELSPIPKPPGEQANHVSSPCSYLEALNKKEDKDEYVCQSDQSYVMYFRSYLSYKSFDQVAVAEKVQSIPKDTSDIDNNNTNSTNDSTIPCSPSEDSANDEDSSDQRLKDSRRV